MNLKNKLHYYRSTEEISETPLYMLHVLEWLINRALLLFCCIILLKHV